MTITPEPTDSQPDPSPSERDAESGALTCEHGARFDDACPEYGCDRQVAETAQFHDELDDDIARSMKDPEYVAAWVADLSPSQRRVLSIISRVNLNTGNYAGWVDQGAERLDKNSLYALERRGFVTYDHDWGAVRIRVPFVAMATACREAAEMAIEEVRR